MKAIDDASAIPGSRSLKLSGITITPPRDCEILLDNRTVEILNKIKKHGSKISLCKDAYSRLKIEIEELPYPEDLFGRLDMPGIDDFRSVFGTWLDCRKEMNDGEDWEKGLLKSDPIYELLDICEKDWQASRVYPYAMLWGAIDSPKQPEIGYEKFFERFSQWKVEYKRWQETKVEKTLQKKLKSLWHVNKLNPLVFDKIPKEKLIEQIEKRIQLVLQKDFKSRHGGVMRKPKDLEIWKQYSRPEIINHFNQQYDPARHNFGVITFSENDHLHDHIVIITKLDTSDAQKQFQYKNRFENETTFRWQSQIKNEPETEPGVRIVNPGKAHLHLFVQPRSHTPSIYCGTVTPINFANSKPIDVLFKLHSPAPLAFFESDVQELE